MERAPVACPSAGTLGGPSCARRARPAAAWWPLARIGAVDLYLAPPGSEQDAPALSVTPVVAAKRGPPRRRRLRRRRRARPDRRVSTLADEPAPAPPAAPVSVAAAAVARPRRTRSASRSSTSSFDELARAAGAPPRDRCASACPATTRRRTAPRRRSVPVTAPRWRASCWRSVRARTSACSRSPGVGGAARPVPGAGRSRRGGRGRGRGLARRRRPDRDERRRLGDAALSARRAARGGAARAGRAGHADLLLGRRSVAQPRPPGRQRRAGRRRSRQPALGAGDRRVRRARAAGTASTRATTARRRPARGRRGRRDLQPLRPGGRAGRARASRAAGASTSPPTIPARPRRWRRPPRPACSQANRELTAAELRALLALTADVPGRRRRRARARRPAPSTRAIASATTSRSATASSTRARRAWRPPIRSASRCSRRARCPTPRRRIAGARAGAGLAAWRCGARRGRGDAARARLPARRRPRQPAVPDVAAGPGGAVLAGAPRPGAAGAAPARRSGSGQDHGALVERIRHALETARDALGPDDGDAAAGLQALEAALGRPRRGRGRRYRLGKSLRALMLWQPMADKGEPRAIALTGDAVGDRRRRRRPSPR